MSLAIDPEIIARYIKVWALAELGVGGEQTSAKARMKDMASKYPGIHDLAQRARARAFGGAQNTGPVTGATQDRSDFDAWSTLSEVARMVFETLNAAQEMSAGVKAAQRVQPFHEFGYTDSGKKRVRVGVQFGLMSLDKISDLDAAGREGFRRAIHEKLDEACDRFFADLDDNEEEEEEELD